MSLSNMRRHQLATSIALAIREPDAQVVPDMRLAVWCVHGEEMWLGYDETSVAEAYRREYNLDSDECTASDVVFVTVDELGRMPFEHTPEGVVTFADRLNHARYGTGRVPRLLANSVEVACHA